MNTTEDKYNDIRELIINVIKNEKIESIKIPDWQPVSIEDGFVWIRSTIYEGYYLKWRTVKIKGKNQLELMSWEYGEDEPEFV